MTIPTQEEIDAKIAAAQAKEQEYITVPSGSAVDSANAAAGYAVDAREHADRAETVVQAHAQDTSLHLSTQDRSDFDHIRSLFQASIPPGTVVAPEEAVPDEWFAGYFARNAQPGMPVAPGNVFVSRVPYAQKNADGSWRNTASSMDTSVYDPADVKLLDNTGLQHKCSTNTTENVDDYVGKKWAFYWARCNYVRDSYGVKWITAVEGETIGLPNGHTAVFDPKKDTGSFGPAIWTFCTLDTGWNTEADGTPNFQLWGIGDSPWEALSTERRNWLTAHGVDETKYRPWSTGLWYDGSEWKRRSYIVDSAYCGTAETSYDGTLIGIGSKYNEPVVNGIDYNSLHDLIGNKFGGGARAVALSIVFDIVKNATKNSQTIHYGMSNNANQSVVAAANTLNPGYVFPIASQGNFEVGGTVYIRTTAANYSYSDLYKRNITAQIGRIIAIENREIEVITSDPTVEPVETATQTKLCLVIDPDTVQPFYARTTTAYATALTGAGVYAAAYALQGIAMAGETNMVIGKHDGYVSGTDGKHPYRVQGMEMMCGVYQCVADCVYAKGTGAQEVTLPDGTIKTPTTSQLVYLYAPSNVIHLRSGSLLQLIQHGYIPVGISEATSGYIFNGYVDPHYGVWYVTATGGGDYNGHADYLQLFGEALAYFSGGSINEGLRAGSACLSIGTVSGYQYYRVGARD